MRVTAVTALLKRVTPMILKMKTKMIIKMRILTHMLYQNQRMQKRTLQLDQWKVKRILQTPNP